MSRALSAYEQKTIISFNKAEDIAHIFTYEKTWQKHLEGKLGLKPVMDNGFGGKDYEIEKNRKQDRRNPQLAKFVYVSTPDAKERFSRAVAILLRAGMKGRRQKR